MKITPELSCDVLIIGSGAAGLSLALRLAEKQEQAQQPEVKALEHRQLRGDRGFGTGDVISAKPGGYRRNRQQRHPDPGGICQ